MFRVTIKTDNAAFDEYKAGEVARILRDLADRVTNGADSFILQDENGNTVGRAGFGR